MLQLIARVSYGFSRLKASVFITFVRNVVTLMTKNVNFKTPSPDLAAVTKAVDDFAGLVEQALNGDRIVIKARNASRVVLLDLARQLAAYVQGNCQSSVAILVSSGFENIKPKSPPALPAVPGNTRLTAGPLSGSLILRFGRGKNISNFSIQTADDSNGRWSDWGLSTKSRVVLEDPTPLKAKWARARANRAAGSSDWSEPTCKIVM